MTAGDQPPERALVVFVSRQGGPDFGRLLARILKFALRACGVKCERCELLPPKPTETTTDTEPRVSDR